jgi:hypothetical protein
VVFNHRVSQVLSTITVIDHVYHLVWVRDYVRNVVFLWYTSPKLHLWSSCKPAKSLSDVLDDHIVIHLGL